jgi:hypothetical protein
MNVVGNNFSMLDVRDDIKTLKAATNIIETNFYENSENQCTVKASRGAFTTGRSILKKNTSSDCFEYILQTRPSRLSFSPFNAVKIIPHRYELEKVTHTLFPEDDDEEIAPAE